MNSLNIVIIFVFIALTVCSSLILPKAHRWKGILVISISMYYLLVGAKILIIFYLALLAFLFAKGIHKKQVGFVLPLLLALIPLIVSKSLETEGHFDSFSNSSPIINYQNPQWTSFLQILGLSYVTFNCISYFLDVKKEYIAPETNFLRFLLYVFFFPIMFSGPLHRYKYLSKQFENIEVTNKSISLGGRLILFGLLKMAVSQRLFVLVNTLEVSQLFGIGYLLVGTVFFLFLYLSFSAFIDIFIGVAKTLGIQLKRNFKNRIYLSNSRQAFWSGWHITLNEWFRDYFFFPLIKRDKSKKYLDLYLLLTFLLIAIWHGFTLSLAIWGLANGIWIILERKVSFNLIANPRLKNILGIVYHATFSSLLSLIFISTDIVELFKRLAMKPSFSFPLFGGFISNTMLTIACFFVIDYHYSKAGGQSFEIYMDKKSILRRWLIYVKMIFLVMLIGNDLSLDNYYNQF